LCLQRGETLAVDIDRLKDFAKQTFEPLKALFERTTGGDVIADRPVDRAG